MFAHRHQKSDCSSEDKHKGGLAKGKTEGRRSAPGAQTNKQKCDNNVLNMRYHCRGATVRQGTSVKNTFGGTSTARTHMYTKSQSW